MSLRINPQLRFQIVRVRLEPRAVDDRGHVPYPDLRLEPVPDIPPRVLVVVHRLALEPIPAHHPVRQGRNDAHHVRPPAHPARHAPPVPARNVHRRRAPPHALQRHIFCRERVPHQQHRPALHVSFRGPRHEVALGRVQDGARVPAVPERHVHRAWDARERPGAGGAHDVVEGAPRRRATVFFAGHHVEFFGAVAPGDREDLVIEAQVYVFAGRPGDGGRGRRAVAVVVVAVVSTHCPDPCHGTPSDQVVKHDARGEVRWS
mmetsp:Transcript_36062/g.70963  ORF Transcript_36062/g.70963 Transcript_36062/m.70963 type:complete len:261 (-) Transcript_36062:187-969(-)